MMDSSRPAHAPQTPESPSIPTLPAFFGRHHLIEEGRNIVERGSQSLGLTASSKLATLSYEELREIAYAEALKEMEPERRRTSP